MSFFHTELNLSAETLPTWSKLRYTWDSANNRQQLLEHEYLGFRNEITSNEQFGTQIMSQMWLLEALGTPGSLGW